jgi:YbbR domain-containing protein
MQRHWQFVLLSVFIATTLWFMVTGRERVETWVDMRIEMTGMPPDMIVLDGLPSKISARIRGPKGLIRGLNGREFSYPLDLSQLKQGENVISVLPDNIPLKGAFQVVEINPPRLQLQADSLITRTLPVEVLPQGALAPDVEIGALLPQPEAVKVRGAQSLVSAIESVNATVRLSNGTMPKVADFPAVYTVPEGVEVTPPQGRVRVTTRLVTTEVVLKRKVSLELPEGIAGKLHSRYVTLTVQVPRSKAGSKEYLNAARVVLAVPDNIAPGRHALKYRLELPENALLVGAKPAALDISISGR